MTRAIVVGPYPPAADATAATTLTEVRSLRAAGRDVVVVSPEPSAARVTAAPDTRRGARIIARLVRGADVVVWIGPEPPDAVARALRRVPDVRMIVRASQRADALSVVERVELLRAGLPTFVRSFVPRRH